MLMFGEYQNIMIFYEGLESDPLQKQFKLWELI
jgi:hypothetical protein